MLWPTIKRALRASVAAFGAVSVDAATQSPNAVWVVPIILAAGKGLREKYKGAAWVKWLPF